MKKFLIAATLAVVSLSAFSQVQISRTKLKLQTKTEWYARLGISLDNLAGGNDLKEDNGDRFKFSIGPKVGMDLNVGFMKNIKNAGLYWGMELGIGTRGGACKEEFTDYNYYGDEDKEEKITNKGSVLTWNLKYTPIMFGYKYTVTDDLKIDGHIGAFVSYDFAGGSKYTWEDDSDEKLDLSDLKHDYSYQPFDAGIQIGVGAWWKNFNFDITYQRGLVTAAEVYKYGEYDSMKLTSSNLMFRIGYAF